jgi:4-nitrophenyl phosphatase
MLTVRLDAIEAKFQFNKKKAVFIGDRLNTDIQFAHNSGMGGSLMVLTGVSTEAEFLADGAPIVPKYYIEKLGDLYKTGR